MIHAKWLRTLTIAAAFGTLLIQGCRKENGIDNNNVIRTPYALYFADKEGALFNTNDGIGYKIIFNPDGYPQRSIITSGTNLLFVKKNLHLSTDNGNNFNPIDLSVNPGSVMQSLALDVPSHNRVYVCSTRGFGLIYSEDNGKTWQDDMKWDPATITSPTYPNSLAQLKSGEVFAYSNGLQKLYKRVNKGDNWQEVSVSGLPPHYYYLSRLNDALLATDTSGSDGVYFSNDKGQSWTQYSGLPATVNLNATYAAFDQTLLVGTHGYGVYRLENGSFVASNNGIDLNTRVYSLTAKSNTFKNGVVRNYIYLGANTGLYRSEDGGQNWIKMYNADIRRIY